MRFKNGNPVVLYAITFQDTGDNVVFTNVKERKAFALECGAVDSPDNARFATYDLREAK